MKTINQFLFKVTVFTTAAFFFVFGAFALNSSGIDRAVAQMSSFMDIAFNLVIAIGSLIGLIGSVRVYIEWQSADQNTRKAIMRWFGACLFLILVSVIVKALFN
ncbi:MAG: DUF4134 domain-containing protein [Mangrovibacterium sp.]